MFPIVSTSGAGLAHQLISSSATGKQVLSRLGLVSQRAAVSRVELCWGGRGTVSSSSRLLAASPGSSSSTRERAALRPPLNVIPSEAYSSSRFLPHSPQVFSDPGAAAFQLPPRELETHGPFTIIRAESSIFPPSLLLPRSLFCRGSRFPFQELLAAPEYMTQRKRVWFGAKRSRNASPFPASLTFFDFPSLAAVSPSATN